MKKTTVILSHGNLLLNSGVAGWYVLVTDDQELAGIMGPFSSEAEAKHEEDEFLQHQLAE